MTTRFPWIMAATLCCLLNFATSASADCAWILWVAADDARGQRVYSLFEAFPKTLREGIDFGWVLCTKARDEKAFPMLSELPRGKSPWAICLPDTVDPRGPKEK